jgi:membrane protease YdiL (CAAX protease family)
MSDAFSSLNQVEGGEHWKLPWGPLSALGYGAAAFIGGQLLAGIVLGIYLLVFGMNQVQMERWFSGIQGNFVLVICAELLTLALVAGFVKIRRGTLGQLGITKLQWKYVWLALAGAGVYIVLYIVLSTVAGLFMPSLNFDQEQKLGFDHPAGTMQLIMTAVSLVVLPPVTEEVLFRGFLYGGLRRAVRFWPAVLITSVLFAVGHLEFGSGAPLLWIAAIDTFALSVVMCYIREKTGSIWSTIIMHVLKNGVAFTFLYLKK